MKHSLSIYSVTLALVLLLMPTGCTRISQKTTSQETDVKPLITTDCIVSYFREGQSPYITQQQHLFGPTTGTLTVIANEPENQYEFLLEKDRFSQSKSLTKFLSDLPAEFINQPLANAIFYSFVTGSDLLETESLESGENIKLEGQWYQPLQVPWSTGPVQVILLKNLSSNQIDSVGITQFIQDSTGDNPLITERPVRYRWLAKSYNLRYSKKLEKLVPRAIDIFDMQEGIASKRLLIQIDYKDVSTNGENNQN